MKTSNRDAGKLVSAKTPFTGNNTFGNWEYSREDHTKQKYVAYSYGYHFPMYTWIDGVWYFNTDKYSVTTGKHKSQLRPSTDDTIIYLNTEQMQKL